MVNDVRLFSHGTTRLKQGARIKPSGEDSTHTLYAVDKMVLLEMSGLNYVLCIFENKQVQRSK